SGTMSLTELQRLSRTLPIVFAAVSDPVGAGVVRRRVEQFFCVCPRETRIAVPTCDKKLMTCRSR
ncbi:MAG: hypothetical protein WBF07_22435, partial [Xanthobacteraceae bacterium]